MGKVKLILLLLLISGCAGEPMEFDEDVVRADTLTYLEKKYDEKFEFKSAYGVVGALSVDVHYYAVDNPYNTEVSVWWNENEEDNISETYYLEKYSYDISKKVDDIVKPVFDDEVSFATLIYSGEETWEYDYTLSVDDFIKTYPTELSIRICISENTSLSLSEIREKTVEVKESIVEHVHEEAILKIYVYICDDEIYLKDKFTVKNARREEVDDSDRALPYGEVDGKSVEGIILRKYQLHIADNSLIRTTE